MTFDINDHYGVTICQTRSGGPFIAKGDIFLRKTMTDIGIEVQGEGQTWAKAAERALAKARAECPSEAPDTV